MSLRIKKAQSEFGDASEKPEPHSPRLFTLKTFASNQQYSILSPIIQHVQVGWGGLRKLDGQPGQGEEVRMFSSHNRCYARGFL